MQRSAAAAQEIHGPIEGSNQCVGRGAVLVQKTGKAIVGIVDGIERDSTLMGDIVVSSCEQASGIARITDSVVRMN